jgi:hypothetical protein
MRISFFFILITWFDMNLIYQNWTYYDIVPFLLCLFIGTNQLFLVMCLVSVWCVVSFIPLAVLVLFLPVHYLLKIYQRWRTIADTIFLFTKKLHLPIWNTTLFHLPFLDPFGIFKPFFHVWIYEYGNALIIWLSNNTASSWNTFKWSFLVNKNIVSAIVRHLW